MAKKITLYIEDTDIKLLVTKGKQVDKWASLTLEPSLVRDGVIIDDEQVAESIKTLLKLGGVSTKKITIGASGLNSIFRIITLPELSQNLLPEAILNEARRVIPVPLDQVYLSYQKLESSPGETRIFLVAYPRNSTDVLINTLKKAGIKSEIMDLAPLALARCANEPKSIIINSWLTYLDIIIMTDKIPQVIRSLSLPTESTAIEDKLPLISEELIRTIAFYNSANPTNQLETAVPVFVCGDLADNSDNWPSLVGNTGHPVSALAPPIEYPETFSPCAFMVNIGLALKDQLPKGEDAFYSTIDLNALPESYQTVAFKITNVLIPLAIIIGIAALAYGGIFIKGIADETEDINQQIEIQNAEMDILRLQNSSLQNDISNLDGEISKYPALVSNIEASIESNVALGTKFEMFLERLITGLNLTDSELNEIFNLLPVTVNLYDINYSGDSVSISGVANNEDDIFGYARAIRSSELFDEVLLSSISGVSTFNFNVVIR
ncbi:MAG: pilus assembly protein PilM [Dehalococcoidia bacterium]|nr:MAG: pilus assembly protein PilM [Dehalococcoidia bacterium]